MKRKTMLLTVTALSVAAFAALPSMASAFTTTPAVTPTAPAAFPLGYKSTGGPGTLFTASGRKVTCESASGEGTFENAHTGSGRTSLLGCKESILGTKCTTAGQSAGTVKSETLPAHSVYLKPMNKEKPHETPGILITPAANGIFATFSCAGGLVKIQIKGNGVLGTVTSPEIGGEASNSSALNVSATEAGQQHTETQEGEKFGLESSTNGGAFESAYLNSGTQSATLNEGATAKTTTETP